MLYSVNAGTIALMDRKLSNLEMTVLGFAWLRGPCTIYAIMKELSLSASSFHKSRAGTAYSIANRLLGFGLLGQEDENVQITPAGEAELKSWFADVPLTDIAHSADLIRLRFFFLGVVDSSERLRFIDESLAGLRTFLRTCEELVPKNEEIGDYFGVLATMSVVLETRARIQWLELVRDWVENPMDGDWARRALGSINEP